MPSVLHQLYETLRLHMIASLTVCMWILQHNIYLERVLTLKHINDINYCQCRYGHIIYCNEIGSAIVDST